MSLREFLNEMRQQLESDTMQKQQQRRTTYLLLALLCRGGSCSPPAIEPVKFDFVGVTINHLDLQPVAARAHRLEGLYP